MNRVGWRFTALLLGALVIVVILPLVARFLRDRPQSDSGTSAPEVAGISVGEGMRSYILWILVFVIFIGSIAQNGALVHLPALLTDLGVPPERGARPGHDGRIEHRRAIADGGPDRQLLCPRVAFVMLLFVAVGAFMLASANSFAMGALAAALIGMGMGESPMLSRTSSLVILGCDRFRHFTRSFGSRSRGRRRRPRPHGPGVRWQWDVSRRPHVAGRGHRCRGPSRPVVAALWLVRKCDD